jgi:thioredoxin reductase (NADPH)
VEQPTTSPAPIVPIIGGGPAGMSCALWLHNYGYRPRIVEQEGVLGGMARLSPYPNDWLLGRPGATTRENAEEFVRHIRQAAVETWLGGRPQHIRREDGGGFALDVAFSDGRPPQSPACPAVVIATGTRFRGEEWLDEVANARRLAAACRVHLGPSYVGEPGADLGSHVAVVGGGDNAFDVARMLVEKGVKATVVMRAQAPRAQPLLVARLRQHESSGKAAVLAGRSVEAIDDAGRRLRVRLAGGGELEADHVVVLFGYRPNTDALWLAGLALDKDADGYLIVDRNMETSCRGVFAIGDISNAAHPCIATAIASGTMAARTIQRRLSAR